MRKKINKCATYYFKHKKIKRKHLVLYIECIYKVSFPLKPLTLLMCYYCWISVAQLSAVGGAHLSIVFILFSLKQPQKQEDHISSLEK